MYSDKMTKKKLKRLILLLRSAYMVQIYVLQGKPKGKLLQTHVRIVTRAHSEITCTSGDT